MLGDADAKARSLEGVDLALAEPGENGLGAQLGKFWSAWANVANDPSSVPARQALIEQAKTVASASPSSTASSRRSRSRPRRARALTAYDPATGRTGDDRRRSPRELEQVGAAIRDAYSRRPGAARPARPPRPAARQALAVRHTSRPSTSATAASASCSAARGDPLVDDARRRRPRPRVELVGPTTLVAPGGKLGALHATSASRRHHRLLPHRARDGRRGARHRGQRHPPRRARPASTSSPSTRRRARAGLTVAVTTDATVGTPGPPPAPPRGANDLACEIAALRGGATDERLHRVRRPRRRRGRPERRASQANAEVLADAVEDRRQSASGVSLDEEMTNLIRFQRGYQASARTMSTLDEMLDVLINRTGRVGL